MSSSSTKLSSSSLSQSNDDDYAEFGFPGEPEKGMARLALLLASMRYEIIDEATRLELKKITEASKRRALKQPKNSEKIKKRGKNERGKDKYPMQYFKKPKLGYGVDDSKLSDYPPMERLKGVVGECSKPFEKVITCTDLAQGEGRLSLVRSYTKETIMPLLNEDEKRAMLNNEKVNVTTFDDDGREYQMVFHRWAKDKYYVLGSGWNPFRKDHSFIAREDWLTIWAFRHKHTGQLCFAIASRRFPVQTYFCPN